MGGYVKARAKSSKIEAQKSKIVKITSQKGARARTPKAAVMDFQGPKSLPIGMKLHQGQRILDKNWLALEFFKNIAKKIQNSKK